MRSTSPPRLRSPDVLRRVLITLGLLVVVRLGFQIPVPGMSTEFLSASRDQGPLFGLLSALSGGAIGQTPIFALGLLPYITASMVLWMLSEFWPSVQAVREDGFAGRRSMSRWMRVAAVPIAAIQALILYTGVFLQHPEMIDEDARAHAFGLGLVVVTSLAAGAIAVMWIGERITKVGLGHGMFLIVVSGIVARVPHALIVVAQAENFWDTIGLLAAIWAIAAVVITCVYKARHRALGR